MVFDVSIQNRQANLTTDCLLHFGTVCKRCIVIIILFVCERDQLLQHKKSYRHDRRQAITWTNAGILLIGTLGTNYSEILIESHVFSFKKMHLKRSSAKWRPFCLGRNVLTFRCVTLTYYMSCSSSQFIMFLSVPSCTPTSGLTVYCIYTTGISTFRQCNKVWQLHQAVYHLGPISYYIL